MPRTFDRHVDIETAPDYTLQRELDMTLQYLADDIRVCGPGYPSPRRETLRQIIVEQERRKARASAQMPTHPLDLNGADRQAWLHGRDHRGDY